MHELSIARAIVGLVRPRVPPGTRLTRVCVSAGPLQAVDPIALSWAWQAATAGTPFSASDLRLTPAPWRLRCEACGRVFQADAWDAPCPCGGGDAERRCHPEGGDELILETLEVEPIAADDDAKFHPFTREVSGASADR